MKIGGTQVEWVVKIKKVMKYILIICLGLVFSSCEKETECCSYNYGITYSNITSIDEECSCCYDLIGREVKCSQL